ncbi:hypothetical protein [Thalassotalea eurytherma]|uniref:Uncharacterized protein n=1 Tax=Thalassotalea eurytherma TaxID=1144278 RepID=A0ABQ6H185_9GAMM|nr:hypothetical protein [Thalassotalea eurytherma]GLX80825.1 hypothetical protein theurythT_02770 [Thalassotalea eurytherma]
MTSDKQQKPMTSGKQQKPMSHADESQHLNGEALDGGMYRNDADIK